MGADSSEPGAKPSEKPHKVTLSKSYYLGIHEDTQNQYLRVMGSHWAVKLDHQFSMEAVSWTRNLAMSWC